MLDIYTRMVLISSICHLFMVVAPLAVPFALLYFALAFPIYTHVLCRVLGRPAVDTHGAVWQAAMRYQTAALLVSQVVFFFVATLKLGSLAPLLALAAFALTLVRTYQLERTLAPHAAAMRLPLQPTDAVDGAPTHAAALHLYTMAARQKQPGTATLVDGLEGALGVGLSLVGRSADVGLGLVGRSADLLGRSAVHLVEPLVGAVTSPRGESAARPSVGTAAVGVDADEAQQGATMGATASREAAMGGGATSAAPQPQ